MIDGAEQCSVLQVISGALLLDGVRVLVVFVLFVLGGLLYQVIEVFTKKSAVHLLLHKHFH